MLSATAKPYIEASVPVLREHGLTITTIFYKNMFKDHPELNNLFNLGNQANGSQQQSLAAAVFAYAANIDNADVLAPVIERIVHKHVSVGIKPEHYPIVGKYLIKAIKEVLGEAATPALIAAWEEAYGLLANSLITAEQTLYKLNKHAPDSWMKMRVIEKIKQSDNVISFTLEANEDFALPKFKAGQYVSVAVFIEALNLRQIRQYSLSDSSEKNTYRITIKSEKADEHKPAGMVSNWLHQHWEVGSVVDISHPYGNFAPSIMDSTPIVLISAGVGVTPMISILNTIADRNPKRSVLFTHGAKSKSTVTHLDEIEAANNIMPHLKTQLFLSESKEHHPNAIQGRTNLNGLINHEEKSTVYYICGAQPFMDKQRETLLTQGVNESQIYREVFGPESLNHLI